MSFPFKLKVVFTYLNFSKYRKVTLFNKFLTTALNNKN